MTTQITVPAIPAHIAARINARNGARSAVLDAVSSGLSFPRVSIRASRYRLVDEGVETVVGTELDVVLVAANPKVSKMWYDKAYSETDEKTMPACFSNDGVKPDPSVAAPVHDNCAQCPKNVLGSRITPNGKQSKECNDIRHVAVLPSADPSKAYGLTIPVSAMKGFRVYCKELSQYGLIPEEVITTLGFDDQASFPKITFRLKGYVPAQHLQKIESLGATPEVQFITRITNGPALAAPKPAAPAAPVAAETASADAPADDPVPTPAKAAAPKATPKVAKPATKEPHEFHSSNAGKAPAASGDAEKALEAQLDNLFGD